MTLSAGERLGLYEILALLGSGGMGEVYRALDPRLKREVAIKVLPEAFADDAERLARFEREARLLAALNHPAIATIHGLEHDGARRYIVMELVEGETLATRIGAEPIPVSDALRLARQIAEGLEAAHARGVVHCDLKPANIALTQDGRVKLLDFGLARAFAPERPAPDASHSPTLTADVGPAGHIFGTVSYMSPEQARGREIDKRTDIWAFGCVLYEMLSGRKAFAGESVPDTLGLIFEADPDFGLLPPKTPAKVRELMRHCFQKDPNRRLRDIGDARIELDDSISGQTAELSEARTPARGRKRLAVAAAAFAVAALALAAFLVWKHRAEAPSASAGNRQLAVLPFLNLTNAPEGEMWGVALADTVSARLSNVRGLQVVTPRATVEAMDPKASIASVARRLGANTVLQGSLQRENDRFRITYRLLDASGAQLAANTFDDSAIFALQDRVADSVVKDLSLRRGAQRTPTPTGLDTPAEQERYLEAIGLLRRYDLREGVEKALRILQKLAEEKPNSALVQAALARADLAMFDLTKERAWADRAISASDAARVLDPGLPEVDVTVGQTLFATGRPTEAVLAFRRALAARPGDVEALLGLGGAAEAAGDQAAAEAAFRRAIELQPSFAVFNQLGAWYSGLGRYAEAADLFRRASRAAPDSYSALSNLGGAETMRCNYPAALVAYRRALELAPKDPSALSNLGLTQLWTGHPTEAVASLERAAKEAPSNFMVLGNLGDAYRASGDAAQADRAYARSVALARAQLDLNPNHVVARCYVATGLAKTGHTVEASQEMGRVMAVDPKEPDTFSDAAIVAALAGRDAEALAFLRKAVAAGYCRETVAVQPEFARFRDNPEFRSIVAAPRSAAGSQ